MGLQLVVSACDFLPALQSHDVLLWYSCAIASALGHHSVGLFSSHLLTYLVSNKPNFANRDCKEVHERQEYFDLQECWIYGGNGGGGSLWAHRSPWEVEIRKTKEWQGKQRQKHVGVVECFASVLFMHNIQSIALARDGYCLSEWPPSEVLWEEKYSMSGLLIEHQTNSVAGFQLWRAFRFLLFLEIKCIFAIYVIGYVNLLNENKKHQLNTVRQYFFKNVLAESQRTG